LLRRKQPEWYGFHDGIHNITGKNEDGRPFAYKLAVRKTPEAWFFLAYDMTQASAAKRSNRAIYISVIFFSLRWRCWWAGGRPRA
jgi:hypothetical protein